MLVSRRGEGGWLVYLLVDGERVIGLLYLLEDGWLVGW